MSVNLAGMDIINPDRLWEKYGLSCFWETPLWMAMRARIYKEPPVWFFSPLGMQLVFHGDSAKYSLFKENFSRTAMHVIVNHNLVVKLCGEYPLIAEAYQKGKVEHLHHPATPINEVTLYFDVLNAAEDLYGTSEEHVVEIAKFWDIPYG